MFLHIDLYNPPRLHQYCTTNHLQLFLSHLPPTASARQSPTQLLNPTIRLTALATLLPTSSRPIPSLSLPSHSSAILPRRIHRHPALIRKAKTVVGSRLLRLPIRPSQHLRWQRNTTTPRQQPRHPTLMQVLHLLPPNLDGHGLFVCAGDFKLDTPALVNSSMSRLDPDFIRVLRLRFPGFETCGEGFGGLVRRLGRGFEFVRVEVGGRVSRIGLGALFANTAVANVVGHEAADAEVGVCERLAAVALSAQQHTREDGRVVGLRAIDGVVFHVGVCADVA